MSKKRLPPQLFNISRRRFLTSIAATTAAAALPGCGLDTPSAAPAPGVNPGNDLPGILPNPTESGIDHIVVVMMENRSYDHMLGWVPNSDGKQAGLQFPDNSGQMQSTFRLSDAAHLAEYGFQGCGKEDPDHSYNGGRTQYSDGKMDGFLKTVGTAGDLFPIGYYTAEDVPFFKGVADNFTLCDRYFCGILSSTFPNRVYMHAGQTDRNNNTLPYAQQPPSTLTTIWDLLAAKSISAQFYFFDLPFIGLWGPKYLSITSKFEQFLIDAATGNLASVSYIDPFFGFSAGESPSGIARDDHPNSDIRDGQAFLDRVYNALRASPQWENTLLIINYDEWGGFYDHVPPPLAPITDAERTLIKPEGNDGRLGFRVPCAILGPRARRKHVSHLQFDTNSILNFIRWRFDLGALSPRDDTSLNLAHALDFSTALNTEAPSFGVPTSPTGFGKECQSGLPFPLPNLPKEQLTASLNGMSPAQRSQVEHQMELASLNNLAKASGFYRI